MVFIAALVALQIDFLAKIILTLFVTATVIATHTVAAANLALGNYFFIHFD